jgi:hypothetical protein
MGPSGSPTLELRRAESGHDLWVAIEASQYARLIDYDKPRTDLEAAWMKDLIDLFTECSEHWERRSALDQKVALEQLGNRLTALGEVGLFVYSGITQRRFDTDEAEPIDLPVAVLIIRRDDQPTFTVKLPGAMDVD